MSNTGWYAARYRSWLPWRRYVVLRWEDDAEAGTGGFRFLDRYGGEEFRGYWATLAGADAAADFANWRDDFHEREVRYDDGK